MSVEVFFVMFYSPHGHHSEKTLFLFSLFASSAIYKLFFSHFIDRIRGLHHIFLSFFKVSYLTPIIYFSTDGYCVSEARWFGGCYSSFDRCAWGGGIRWVGDTD